MAFRKIKAGLVKGDVEQFIGETGNLFYDITDGALRISDGLTPGGTLLSSGGGSYTLPTASSVTKGGVRIGDNITITNGVISVAAPFSGSYNDLTNKPTIPSLSGYATESFVTSQGYLTSIGTISYNDLSNKPTLFSGSYTDLTNKPSLFSGSYTDLTNKPTLVTSYNDLTDKPTIPTNTNQLTNGAGFITGYTETDPVFLAHAAHNVTSTKITNWDTAYGWGNHASAGYLTSVGTISYNDLSNKPTLFSGSYNDLTDKPTIPSLTGYATESFVTSQGYLTSVGTISYTSLSDKPTLFSGSYTDLTNKPTIYSSAYIGTTSLDFTRASASQTLTGVSIDGSVTWTNSSPSPSDPFKTVISAASGTATIVLQEGLPGLGSSVSWTFDKTKLTFPDASQQTTAYTGNAATVTNGVYTTDTGTVTNTMLAGSIANNKLANSSITVNGSATSLGGSVTISTITGNAGTATTLQTARNINGVSFNGSADITVTAAAGTLTGTGLNSTVVNSNLQTVGQLESLQISGGASVTSNSATTHYLNFGTVGQIFDDGNLHIHTKTGNMWINTLDSSNIYIGQQYNSGSGSSIISNTPYRVRTSWNAAIDTEVSLDNYRYRISNSGGIFPQIISNISGQTVNTGWVAVGAISGSAITQVGNTGALIPNNSWTTLYNSHGMDSSSDTVVATVTDKAHSIIHRVTFTRSDNGSTTGYNILVEKLW